MPFCGLRLEGLAKEWTSEPDLVARLTAGDRLIQRSGVDDMKPCNKDVSFNHQVLRPLLQRVADHANWELFSLPEITRQLLAKKSGVFTGYVCICICVETTIDQGI